ncbi:unnamed protein product, partial [Pylaiella littoralis]
MARKEAKRKENKRAARVAREAHRKKVYLEASAALNEAVRYLKFEGIVEKPEKLRDANGTAAAARQAGAINSFVKLELEYGPHASIHSDMAALTANVSGRTLRSWVRHFVRGSRFKIQVREYSKRSLHSFIEDEDIRTMFREYLDERIYRRKKTDPQLRVQDVHRWINTVLLKDFITEESPRVSLRTTHAWMQAVGFRWRRHRKCVYVDGHNRPDVVEHRQTYVQTMLAVRTSTAMLVKQGEGPEAREVMLWPATREVAGEKEQCMHVELAGECDWEKFHNQTTSGVSGGMSDAEQVRLWATPPMRTPATPLPPGWELRAPKDVMEVIYHDECAWKEND